MKEPSSTTHFIRDYRLGSSWRWRACLSARRVVQNGEKLSVAQQLALNTATIDNMAIASTVYIILRKYAGENNLVADLHRIRTTLTYYHFVTVGRAMIAHDIPLPDIFDALKIAADNNAPTRVLGEFLAGEYGDDDANANAWKPALRRTMKELDGMLNLYGVPHELKETIRSLKSQLANYL